MRELEGVVCHVPGDDRPLPGRFDDDADMAGGVAWRRFEPDLLIDAVVGGHEVAEASIHHRLHRVFEHGAIVLRLGAPVVELVLHEQVTGVAEGGHPLAVDKARVPADVIHMQVGASHGVDRLGGESGGSEVVEEGRGELLERRRAWT